MNIILDFLPESVTVDDEDYSIDADFRTWIIYETLINDEKMSRRERVSRAIYLVYGDDAPENISAAVERMLWFYRCGDDVAEERRQKRKQRRKNGEVELKPKLIFDYEYDAPYIYGAFMTQYQIDLNEIEFLHWWKFQALFRSLDDRNRIVEIMGYRATDLSKIKDKEERARIARLQDTYALPCSLTVEEKIAAAGAAFGGGF